MLSVVAAWRAKVYDAVADSRPSPLLPSPSWICAVAGVSILLCAAVTVNVAEASAAPWAVMLASSGSGAGAKVKASGAELLPPTKPGEVDVDVDGQP